MRLYTLICAFCLIWSSLFAQDSTQVHPLFEGEEVLEVRIATNMKSLFKDVGANRTYHPARFSYLNDEGDSVHFQMKIKTRGHFRRNPSHCNCPPLKLNFKKEELEGSLFAGQNKLKMVTHCQHSKPHYEQNLIQEYFIYKAYILFTEASFRVRLMRVTYVDSAGRMDDMQKFAFLIEDEDHMAARNDAIVNKRLVMHPDQGQRVPTNRLCLFEYMIGNTDFSIGQQHNVKLISPDPLSLKIPVPYDFDWSGLVNAPYAKPNPQLNLGNVRERLFRGFCRSEEEFYEDLKVFRKQKETILAMYQALPNQSEKERKRGLTYLTQFFEIIDNPKKVKREFVKGCRK